MSQRTYDAIVVGGGINGSFIAYWLARQEFGRILILDSDLTRNASTRFGNGLLRQHHSDPMETKLAIRGSEFFREWGHHVGGSCDYVESGFLFMVGPEDVELLRTNIATQRTLGPRVLFLDPEEILILQPHLQVEGIGGAVYEPYGGSVDQYRAWTGLIRANLRLGVEIRSSAGVVNLILDGGRITGVRTSDATLSAGVVVLAAGGASGPLAARAGVSLPLETKQVSSGMVVLPSDVKEPAAFLDATRRLFFEPRGGAMAAVTLRDPRSLTVVEPGEFHDWPEAKALDMGLADLANRMPALQNAIPVQTWAGLDGFTPDGRGIYGSVGVDGLFVCVGASQKGMKVAPAVGEAVAQLIALGHSELDLTSFGLDRFSVAEATASLGYGAFKDLV